MKIFHPKRQKSRLFCLVSSVCLVVLIGIIPVRLALAVAIAPLPQAILTLGGGIDREQFTAKFAQKYPALEIWVSSGTPPEIVDQVFLVAGISNRRIHIDRRAVDTVTNFTSLVKDFKKRNFHHLYLITSEFHMLRAKAIATLVLGSHGIAFTPVCVPSNQPPEAWETILRDISRALLWLCTGYTGASLNSKL